MNRRNFIKFIGALPFGYSTIMALPKSEDGNGISDREKVRKIIAEMDKMDSFCYFVGATIMTDYNYGFCEFTNSGGPMLLDRAKNNGNV